MNPLKYIPFSKPLLLVTKSPGQSPGTQKIRGRRPLAISQRLQDILTRTRLVSVSDLVSVSGRVVRVPLEPSSGDRAVTVDETYPVEEFTIPPWVETIPGPGRPTEEPMEVRVGGVEERSVCGHVRYVRWTFVSAASSFVRQVRRPGRAGSGAPYFPVLYRPLSLFGTPCVPLRSQPLHHVLSSCFRHSTPGPSGLASYSPSPSLPPLGLQGPYISKG